MISFILSKNFFYSSIFLCAFSFFPKQGQSIVEEPRFTIENMHCNIGKAYFELKNISNKSVTTCFLKNDNKECMTIEGNKTVSIEKNVKDSMNILFIKNDSLFTNYFLKDKTNNVNSIKKWYLEKEQYPFSYKIDSGSCGYAYNK